jgi:tight adherence protein C
MPEVLIGIGSLVAGTSTATAVLALAHRHTPVGKLAAPMLARGEEALAAERGLAVRRRLAVELERAGWRESPEAVAVFALVLAAGLTALGLSTAFVVTASTACSLALAGGLVGIGAIAFSIRSSARHRRRRLMRELAPLLELFVLELGGGGSAQSALGSVTMQIDGELTAEIRRLLIASQVAGSATFESRLRAYAELLQIPPLSSLATILTASREYGTGVTQGVRALAADLRRAQRRELIAHSRRALNHVLFPAAVGVLLPFLAILLYPAITSLQANLR